MNRIDFSEILDRTSHNIEDSNEHFEAIDAIYNMLRRNPCVSNIKWVKKSDYDLSFIIQTSQDICSEDTIDFGHLREYMTIISDRVSDTILNIHIKYNSR